MEKKGSHLKSGEHKTRRITSLTETIVVKTVVNVLSDKSRHFQIETHKLKSQIPHSPKITPKLVVIAETYIKDKTHPKEDHDMEEQTMKILSQKIFPRFKCQVRYPVVIVETSNAKEGVFKRWIKSHLM